MECDCLTDQAPECLGGDESLALLVVHPEGVLQLLLHRLHVRVLNQEGGAQLAELTLTQVLSKVAKYKPEIFCNPNIYIESKAVF